MINLINADALDMYWQWPAPMMIMCDGPYGVGGYDGDLPNQHGLVDFYKPHVAAWNRYVTAQTTLWFWNTEVGWAEVHPLLQENGWIYRACCVWNKGIAHAAGNTNTKTLRKFPVVTEVCVHYVRKPVFYSNGSKLNAQDWLRQEWIRTKLPFNKANEACEVKNAATRKYLTTDHVWYFPPADVFLKLAEYTNKFGDPAGKPYFSMNGEIITGSQWERLRGKFYCPAGVTNVWDHPALRGSERIKDDGKVFHPNQKPLKLMELLVRSTTDEGDCVWEPFGGLCSASLAAQRLNRNACATEISPRTFDFAQKRLGISPVHVQ